MKKLAIMTVVMILSLFCLTYAFADIINPDAEAPVDDIPLVISTDESGNLIAEDKTTEEAQATETVDESETAPIVEVESGESTETKEESKGIEDGKGGNPIGGIIAIVVVLLLVVLIAFLNRG